MGILTAVGYDPALAPSRMQVTTGSGVESIPLLPVAQLRALGQDKAGLTILAHTLPPTAGVDGVVGLDFMRGQKLTIDFGTGLIDLQ